MGHVLIWIAFLALFAWCAWVHVRENRLLERRWHTDLDEPSARWLTRFAWSRTWQLLAALGGGMLIIAVYDWQLGAARQEAENKPVAAAVTPSPVAPHAPAPAAPPQNRHAFSPPAAPTQPSPAAATPPSQPPVATAHAAPSTTPAATASSRNGYYPPLAASAPENPPGNAPATNNDADKLANIVSPGETVEDLYNPEKERHDSQSAMDDIKKRYEDILVTYFFLKKCGKSTPEDYRVIMSALAQEMASVNAPGRMQYDILTAAQGSYKEMYAGSSCGGQGFDTLYTQYANYIKVLSANFPAQ